MKAHKILSAALALVFLSGACANNAVETAENGTGNPYLPLWEHLPDGEPRVFDDPDNPGKQRIYIIGSHDVAFVQYCGADIRMWSAPVEDPTSWRDEGPIMSFQDPKNGLWDIFFAPDLVEVPQKDGTKVYYLYPHSRGPRREALVAKSNRPDGPFEWVNLAEDGRSAVEGSCMGFDPSVFIEKIEDPNDPDYGIGYRAYGFWGFQQSNAAQLDPEKMYCPRPGMVVHYNFIPAMRSLGMRGPRQQGEGLKYPALFPGEQLIDFAFFEASSIRQVGNKYVLVYSGFSGPAYGLPMSNSTLRYAYGDSPMGPWKSGGVVVDSRGPVVSPDGETIIEANSAHNTHGSIEKVNGQWYVFYHRPPRGFGFARQAMVAPITVTWDETPVAQGGKVVIRGYDPAAPDKVWTAKAANGLEYTGAEVTSEGFHINGLDPFKYYSAGYACYLSRGEVMQDTWDIWDNNMLLKGLKGGETYGWKYFNFDDANPGDRTTLNLFLIPSGAAAKINVWIDGPTTKNGGKQIGTLDVPEGLDREETTLTLDLSEALEGLDGKHALYIRPEGDEGELFDLVGLGFTRGGKEMHRLIAPKVSIKVGGEEVEMPSVPVRMTGENGYTGYDRYAVDVTRPDGKKSVPKVSAKADSKDVQISIEQAKEVPGTAKVVCVWKGVTKTYDVNIK
ncbi:MAG: hypothetical protein HUJ89_07410 [Bacteroidales bacterium]|nr:hypothetical protein [Bacteroidales bacterium]